MRGVKAKQIRKLAVRIYTDARKQNSKVVFKRIFRTLKRAYMAGGFKIGDNWTVDRHGVTRKYG